MSKKIIRLAKTCTALKGYDWDSFSDKKQEKIINFIKKKMAEKK